MHAESSYWTYLAQSMYHCVTYALWLLRHWLSPSPKAMLKIGSNMRNAMCAGLCRTRAEGVACFAHVTLQPRDLQRLWRAASEQACAG